MVRMETMLNTIGFETLSQAIMYVHIEPRLQFRKAFSLERFKVADTGLNRYEYFNEPGSTEELQSTLLHLGFFAPMCRVVSR